MAYLKKENLKYYFLLLLLLFAVLVWFAVFAESGQELTVAFLDVGQGDAIFIEAPNGNQILFDGGPNKTVLSELSGVMPFYDRFVDALILSHPQQDHLGGLVEVLKRYKVAMAFEPGTSHTLGEFKAWENLIAQNNIERILARAGMRVWLDQDIYMDILSPFGNENAGNDLNQVMVVGRLVYKDTSFLLTGDLTKEGEYKLIAQRINLDSDVLKVGHHGSKNSTTNYFLREVRPLSAVISAGADNRYGHPSGQTLQKLQTAGIKILRTDQSGTIIMQSDGREIKIKSR